jgi:drug/metabolite transporter (DMT)-like permease
MLVFGAVVGEALFTIFRKILSQAVSPLATATFMSVLGFFMFLPFSIYEACNFDFTAISLIDWLPIFYYAIVVTVIAFILWFQGVSKVPASTAAVFTGIIPISAVFLSVIVLSEPVSLRHIFAVLCVFLGIVFITRSPSNAH